MNSTSEIIRNVNKCAAQREWKPLAQACFGGGEKLLRNALLAALSRFPPADRISLQEAERSIGKGKALEDFTLGELARVIRMTRFFENWERAYTRNLTALKGYNLDGLTQLRNDIAHEKKLPDEGEAVFAYSFLKLCLDAFAPQGESLPTREALFGYVPALDSDLQDPLPANPEPFRLLTWKTKLTSFVGRQQEFDTLLKWVCNSDAHSRAWILTGSGGAGKTRLAATLCSKLRESGWSAKFLQTGQMPTSFDDKPSLFIIDYPEERQDEITGLFGLVKKIETRNTPLRLLFLTRKEGVWWERFLGELHVDTLFESGEIRLHKLTKEDAATLFQEAYEKVRDHYKLEASNVTKDQIFGWYSRNEQLNSSPLFITATAIHCALDGDVGLSLGGADVIQALVKRECDRLRPEGNAAGLGREAGPRLKALAGIPGRIESSLLKRLADPELEIGLPSPLHVVDALRRTALWKDNCIPAASPDICAAALLFTVLNERSDMAPKWLWTVLQEVKQGAPDLLGRLSHDISLIHPSKPKTPDGDGEDGQEKPPPARQFAQWLIEMLNHDAQRANRLEELLTEFRPPVSVLPVSVEVGLILTAAPNSDEPKHAERLNCLAERLWESGRFKEALGPIERAVALRRQLSLENSLIKVALGKSLISYTLILQAINKNDDAIRAVNEGVAILREASSNADVDSLHALGRCLNAKNNVYVGKDSAIAREAAQEVVKIYQGLSKKDPNRFDIWLARGLHNLSNCESDNEIAANTLSRAVDIKRHLMEKAAWRYEPDFALSAALMAKRLLNQKKVHEAYSLSREVVAIYSRQFEVNPTRFASDLLDTLAANELILRELGKNEEALSSEDRRIKLMGRLLSIREDVIDEEQQTDLLLSLVTMANHASHLGRHEEARRACDRVLEIAPEMTKRNPDVWNPTLHLAVRGAYLNRGNARRSPERKEAIADYAAAIRLSDEFEARSGVDERNLIVRSLAQINMAMEMFDDNQSDEALAMVKAGIEGEQRLRREFGEKHYANHEAQLLLSFNRLIDYLIRIENRDLISSVASILSRLETMIGETTAHESPQEVASRKLLLGDSLLKAGCTTEGIELLRKGVNLGQGIVADLDGFSDVDFLNNLGYCAARLYEEDNGNSNLDQAQTYITRAMALLKDDDYLRSITLDSLGYILTLRGKSQNSAAMLTEAIHMLEEARQLALKIGRQDLLPAVDRHIHAAQSDHQAAH